MNLITNAFVQFQDRTFLDMGSKKVTFADLSTRAQQMAAQLREMPQRCVVCDCADVERYIAVFAACVISDRTVVPFSTLKLSFDDLSDALPSFVYIDDKGLLSTHDGSGTAQRSSSDVYCLFTSGTTGKPKGILVSASNLNAYVEGIASFIPEYSAAHNISAVFSAFPRCRGT